MTNEEEMVYVGTPDGSNGYEIPASELDAIMRKNQKASESREKGWSLSSRALERILRRAKAEAWDEGFTANHVTAAGNVLFVEDARNPYREVAK